MMVMCGACSSAMTYDIYAGVYVKGLVERKISSDLNSCG